MDLVGAQISIESTREKQQFSCAEYETGDTFPKCITPIVRAMRGKMKNDDNTGWVQNSFDAVGRSCHLVSIAQCEDLLLNLSF